EDLSADESAEHVRYLWTFRTTLRDRRVFGVPIEQRGLRWWDLREVYRQRLITPLTIAFGEVATHNHFVLNRNGTIFKHSAPVIKLPTGTGVDEHLGLLGLLNSSLACFWLRQVCHSKGGGGINEGYRGEKCEFFFAFNSSRVSDFPLCDERPT